MKLYKRFLVFLASIMAALIWAALLPGVARTETITVTTSLDGGAGSLRQAIADAAAGDTIVFDDDYTIYLNDTLTITKSLIVDGYSHSIQVSGDTGNDGSRNVRVFYIAASGGVTLSHLNIVSGTIAGNGGGIYNGSVLTVHHCTIAGNSATQDDKGEYGDGGGIFNLYDRGTLMVQNSTLAGNSADWGGGIYNDSTLMVQNSTLAGNSADWGGGICNNGDLTVTNSTLAGNLADHGGGVADFGWGDLTVQNGTLVGNSAEGIYNLLGMLYYRNTLIANSSGRDCVSAQIDINVRNLVEDGSCSAALSGDPRLGPLANNGGDTQTFALLSGSPAIDAGDNTSCPATDQRGMARPQGVACDIGAYEAGLVIGKAVTPKVGVPYHGVVTYTLVLANASAVSATNVSLTDTLPAQVEFGGWLASHGATVANNEITWHGAVTAAYSITFTFTATHTGDYGETAVNKAAFSGAGQTGSAVAAFSVECPPLIVTSAQDSGAGSLRQAIADICPGGVIDFAGDMTIYLNSTLVITKPLTIDGSDHAIKVSGDTGNDGSRNVRVFAITAGDGVTLSHLSVVSGTSTDYNGGGIINYGALTMQDCTIADNVRGGGITNWGALTVLDCTIADNVATYRGGGITNYGTLAVQNSTLADNVATHTGGGIYNDGEGTVQDCTLASNSADQYGGSIYNNREGELTVHNSTLAGNSAAYGGGGIYNLGILTVTNSTLAGNSADWGGGIHNLGILTVINSTLAGNLADSGGGIINNDYSTLHYRNTLIANSLRGGDCANHGNIRTNTHNLVGDGSCSAALSGDPLLGPLADNGGDTQTFALLPGSPAIDAGDPASCPATDQRGMARPQGATCDIGAYEAALVIGKAVTPKVGVPYHGVVTYTLVLANLSTVNAPNVNLTDTLPAQVDFGGWLMNHGATVANNEITWHGAVTAASSIIFTFTATHTGWYSDSVANTVVFSDGVQTGSATAVFTVEPNYAPELAAIGPQSVNELVTLAFTATATDDGRPAAALTFTLDTGSVGDITPAGAFTWTPGEADGPGVFTTTVCVSDGALSDSETFSITVNDVNVAPVADADAFTVTENSHDNRLDVLAGDTDADGDSLSVFAVGTPDRGGAAFNAGVAITYTPMFDFAGSEVFTYTISDSHGGFATAWVTLTVTPLPTYTLRVATVGSGTVTLAPNLPIYKAGTPVTLTATPNSGWQFDGWSGASTAIFAQTRVVMNSNKVITATFKPLSIACVAITDVELRLITSGNLYPGDVVFSAELVPLTSTIPYSYTLNGGATLTGSTNPLDFTLTYTKTGTYTIALVMWNCPQMEPVMDTIQVVIQTPPTFVYLPLVLRNYSSLASK